MQYFDVKKIANVKADCRTVNRRVIIHSSIVADIGSHCKSHRFRLGNKHSHTLKNKLMTLLSESIKTRENIFFVTIFRLTLKVYCGVQKDSVQLNKQLLTIIFLYIKQKNL